MLKPMEKSWLSPFLLVTYIATSVTGIIMLFHVRFPGLYAVHEWGGVLFIIAGILHLVINWRMFTSYFKRHKMKRNALYGTIIGLCFITVIAAFIPSTKHSRHHHHQNSAVQNDFRVQQGSKPTPG